MSDPVTALGNPAYSDGIAEIREIGPLGMVTLRGDLADRTLRKAASDAAGVAFPDQLACITADHSGIAWMSPDEVLVMCAYADVSEKVGKMTDALASKHALVANVSDARAVFEVSGPYAREVIAKLAPVDMAPEAFTPGMFRRTRFAQVPAAFWMRDDHTFRIVCFRSVGQYMFDLLSIAAQPGSEVDHF